MFKISSFTLATLAAGAMMFQSQCRAFIYDAAAGYSLLSNPAGVWSYGYSTTLGGVVTLDGENFVDANGLYVWRETGSGNNGPAFAYNPTANPITITGPTDLSVWAPYQLSMSPGSINLNYCVLQFTAPATSQYQVQGAFSSVDQYYGASTDVHILKNGTSIYDGLVQGITSVASFNQGVLLNAGDSLDFVVGVDGYGGGWDITGLAATVTPVPEPSILSLLILGLPLAGCILRKSKVS